MFKKASMCLLILMMIIMIAGTMQAAPKLVNSAYSNDLNALTTSWSFAQVRNLVWWNADTTVTRTVGSSNYLYRVGNPNNMWNSRHDDSRDSATYVSQNWDIIPSNYSMELSGRNYSSIMSKIMVTPNAMNYKGSGTPITTDPNTYRGRYRISPSEYDAVPIMVIDLKQNSDAYLFGMTFTVAGNYQFNPLEDLRPITRDKNSGLQVYEDISWSDPTVDDPNRFDSKHDRLLTISLDSLTQHYNNGIGQMDLAYGIGLDPSAWPAGYRPPSHSRTGLYTNPTTYRTWIPVGDVTDFFQGNNRSGRYYGWQIYFEYDSKVDLKTINAGARLPFNRFWVAILPSKCCDVHGPISANQDSTGDQFFFSLVQDLTMSTAAFNALSGNDQVYRILPKPIYLDASYNPTNWVDFLMAMRQTMLIRPRYYNTGDQGGIVSNGSVMPNHPWGSEASWFKSDGTPVDSFAAPALWDIPGMIHGWKGNYGPISSVIDPLATDYILNKHAIPRTDSTWGLADVVDSLKYTASQHRAAGIANIYINNGTNDPLPYTSDSLQIISFTIKDDDNCVNYDSVFMVIDTGNATFTGVAGGTWSWKNTGENSLMDSIGIDSVILIDHNQAGFNAENKPNYRRGQAGTYGGTIGSRAFTFAEAADAGWLTTNRAAATSNPSPMSPTYRNGVTAPRGGGLLLIRDTATCIDTLIFNVARWARDNNGDGDLADATEGVNMVWKDGMIVTARLYAKDKGGNAMFLNYTSNASKTSNVTDGEPNYKWADYNNDGTCENWVETRFAVDLSAPIAKMTCPTYIVKPSGTLDNIPIRVVNVAKPRIDIQFFDNFEMDSTSATTQLININGEDNYNLVTGTGTPEGANPIYVHDGTHHLPTYSGTTFGNYSRRANAHAKGSGFDPHNFAILLSVWDCGARDAADGDDFNPGNFNWGTMDAEAAWDVAARQVLVTDTIRSNTSVYWTQDATTKANGVLSLDLSKAEFNALYAVAGTGLTDGSVVLVEIIDANRVLNRVAALADANELGHNKFSDGAHDRPDVLWSRWTFNDNELDDGDVLDYTSANDWDMLWLSDAAGGYWSANTVLEDPSANVADHDNGSVPEAWTGLDGTAQVLNFRFAFRHGDYYDAGAGDGYAFAAMNPNKHFNRYDESDSPDDGDHDGPEYTAANLFATDTLGWFYVDAVGPIVDVDAVYPMMRRSGNIYDNRENRIAYTSDPYQVITVDLSDLSCETYADSFAAGMLIDSIVMTIKVTGCNGEKHPYYGDSLVITNNPSIQAALAARGITVLPLRGAAQGAATDPAFYIDDPTETARAVIDGVSGTALYAAIDPATRIIFDPRLGPKIAANDLLGFGLGESQYRFRDGDRVCIHIRARDNATGSCPATQGNPLMNDTYDDQGDFKYTDIFTYQFNVDTQDPELTLQRTESGCHNFYYDIALNDYCDDCFEGERCSTWVAGADSIFIELLHWDYVDGTRTRAANPTVYRLGVGPDDYSIIGLRSSSPLDGKIAGQLGGGTEDGSYSGNTFVNSKKQYTGYLRDGNGVSINGYNAFDKDGAGGNDNETYRHTVDSLRLWFDCDEFNDGDSVAIRVWGRDRIDVPWYPLDATHVNVNNVWTNYAYDRANQLASIDHDAQVYPANTYNFRKDYEHANWDFDSTSTVDSITTNYNFFKRYGSLDKPTTRAWWWAAATADGDWRHGKFVQGIADSVTLTEETPGAHKYYNFARIHWSWVCPFALDAVSHYDYIFDCGANAWENAKDAYYPYWETNGIPVGTTSVDETDNSFDDAPTTDNDYDWASEGAQVGPVDPDWTDLDTIYIANNIHHNWAMPVRDSFVLQSSVAIVDVRDVSGRVKPFMNIAGDTVISQPNIVMADAAWGTNQNLYIGREIWTWTYNDPLNAFPVRPFAARSNTTDGGDGDAAEGATSLDVNDVTKYRTGLIDSIGVLVSSCYDYTTCSTYVRTAVECYNKSGSVKWIWPFPVDSATYGAAGQRKNWSNAFATSKTNRNANWSLPTQWATWDCACPNQTCNGIRWRRITGESVCNSEQYLLTIDLDNLTTYLNSGNAAGTADSMIYLSEGYQGARWTTAYEDGDSVVVYLYVDSTKVPNMYPATINNDKAIFTSWYYIIDQKAPRADFSKLEMYTPQIIDTLINQVSTCTWTTTAVDTAINLGNNATIYDWEYVCSMVNLPKFLALESKGQIDENLEAKYADFTRMTISGAMDVQTARTFTFNSQSTNYTSAVGLTGTLRDIFAVNGYPEDTVDMRNLATHAGVLSIDANALVVPGTEVHKHRAQAWSNFPYDTVYYGTVWVQDMRVNVREYLDTIYFTIWDKLGNDTSYKKSFVVDNIAPKMVWNYCDNADKMNWTYFGNKGAAVTDSFFGYYLDPKLDHEYFRFELDDYIDSLGVGVFQAKAEDDLFAEFRDVDTLYLKGHRKTARTAPDIANTNKAQPVKNICLGRLYFLVNFNDLMNTGTENGRVRFKPEFKSWTDVVPLQAEDCLEITRWLEGWDGRSPVNLVSVNASTGEMKAIEDGETVKQVSKKLAAKDQWRRDGWIDENSWIGQVVIRDASWGGIGKLSVEEFIDKAGNKMVPDNFCFRVEVSTSSPDITIIAEPDVNDIYPDRLASCDSSIELNARIKNRASLDTVKWSFYPKATYSGNYGSETQIYTGNNTMYSMFSTTIKPMTNAGLPYKFYYGGDSTRVEGYWQPLLFDAATFATRKNIAVKIRVAGASSCAGSDEMTVDPVQIDFEKPYIKLDTPLSIRTSSNNYRSVRMLMTFLDDINYYNTTDTAQNALSRAEIQTVVLRVKDITANGNWATVKTWTNPTLNNDTTIGLDNLVTSGAITNVYDSLLFRMVVTDDACNMDSVQLPVRQIIDIPTFIARGPNREEAIQGVLHHLNSSIPAPATGREIWPPFARLDRDSVISINDILYTIDSVQVTTFTHYNLADQDPDVNDPWGENFTRTKRDYPFDSVFVFSYSVPASYITADSGLWYVIEGDRSANGTWAPGTYFWQNAENPEIRKQAQSLTVAGQQVYCAPIDLEDEDSEQEGLVRVSIKVGKLNASNALLSSAKYWDYSWFLLDTEDPTYVVQYLDNSNTVLNKVTTAVDVHNTETKGLVTVDNVLAAANTEVYITKPQNIKAWIDMNQTIYDNNRRIADTARLWKHVNVDFETPSQVNTKVSDESWQINEGTQVFTNYNSWLVDTTLKRYEFKTQIKNGSAANSGFSWVKVEERDAAGNYVRDWSTDKCQGMVIYLDTEAPSAPNANTLGAVPSVTLLSKAGMGSGEYGLEAQAAGQVKVFGFAGAAIDDSWDVANLKKDGKEIPCVKVSFTKDGATKDTTVRAEADGKFSVVVDMSTDSSYNVSIIDYAGNISPATSIKLSVSLTVKVNLTTGWNLFSVNVKGGDLKDVVKANSDVQNSFIYFYAQTRDGGLMAIARDTLLAYINRDQAVGYNVGDSSLLSYWLYVNNNVTLTVTGPQISPTSQIKLVSGWNYVGYPVERNAKISAALQGQFTKLATITNGKWIVKVENGTPTPDTMMYTTEGFMVKATDSVTIQFNANAGLGGLLAKAPVPARSSDVALSRYFQGFNGKAEFYGKPAYEGDRISAYNSRGIKCGEAVVGKDGSYQMLVYGNDKITDSDEGVDVNEVVSFRINDEDVSFDKAPIFSSNWDVNQLNLTVLKPLPKSFALHQNVPNPFNPSTIIKYDVPSKTQVSVVIYNVLGEKVATLVNNTQEPGSYSIKWDGLNGKGEKVASGLYFCKMKAGNFQSSKEMMLVK